VDPYLEPKKRGMFEVIDTGNRMTTGTVVQRIIEHRLEFTVRNAKKEKREAEYVAPK